MYTYKYIKIPHSMWTGRPEEDIESIIDDYAANGWRFVQVYTQMQSSGKKVSKVIFEREVPDDFYSNIPASPKSDPKKYDTGGDEFV